MGILWTFRAPLTGNASVLMSLTKLRLYVQQIDCLTAIEFLHDTLAAPARVFRRRRRRRVVHNGRNAFARDPARPVSPDPGPRAPARRSSSRTPEPRRAAHPSGAHRVTACAREPRAR